MLAERRDQLRVALLDLLQGQPAWLVHQVDEAEVPRAEDDRVLVAHVLLGPALLAGLFALAGCLVEGRADHLPVLVLAADTANIRGRRRPAHEVVEAVAVSLLEGRTLSLTVVGEDDDVVRPRCIPPRALDAAELLVELAE